MRYLFAWIGIADLKSTGAAAGDSVGPIAQALDTGWFDAAVLLDDHGAAKSGPWRAWIANRFQGALSVCDVALAGPTDFGDIYRAAVAAVCDVVSDGRVATSHNLTFHLSPGTPAMAAVWLLLAKARFGASLIESSRDHGVRRVDVPFDIAADFLPDLLRQSDRRLAVGAAAQSSVLAQFGDIVFRAESMQRLVQRAQMAAVRSVPVLILGETGTGKELLARAIHAASPRSTKPFVAVNCGAIPAELVDTELFGHERGAFTGAVQASAGFFEQAHCGTLFLDELGELPLHAQVRLLRVLQSGEVRRVGARDVRHVDVRVIAATHRDLLQDVAAGRFREDLFFRLAVAVLRIPPLRDRRGDVGLLVDRLWMQVCIEVKGDPNWLDKEISVPARNRLLAHQWPGNVRELLNTLRRAALWSTGPVVTAEDVEDALLSVPASSVGDVLNRPIGNGFSLPETIAEVARHYLTRALNEASGNKTSAAGLVGLASYQTLTNWLARYEVTTEME